MEPVIIKLEAWEYEHACDVGIRRYTANWDKQDAPHYQDKTRQEDNRTAQVASAVCELAVAKHTNRYWSGHVWHASEHNKYRHIADVGANIEVRRLRTRDSHRSTPTPKQHPQTRPMGSTPHNARITGSSPLRMDQTNRRMGNRFTIRLRP